MDGITDETAGNRGGSGDELPTPGEFLDRDRVRSIIQPESVVLRAVLDPVEAGLGDPLDDVDRKRSGRFVLVDVRFDLLPTELPNSLLMLSAGLRKLERYYRDRRWGFDSRLSVSAATQTVL